MESKLTMFLRQEARFSQRIKGAFSNRNIERCTQNNVTIMRTYSKALYKCSRHQISFKCYVNGTPHMYSCDIFQPKQTTQTYAVNSRYFQTSGRKDAFPPLIWAVVSFASKTGAVLTGRQFRNKYKDWLKGLPIEEQDRHNKRRLQFFAALGAFWVTIGLIYYYAHEQECPMTGRKRFITLTRDQFLKVANYESESLTELYKEKLVRATDPRYDFVLKIALRIVQTNQDFPGMKEQTWTIHVINDDEKNAFVLPNGNIFVFTGMLEFIENEDQFAFVLGHEMSHALLSHGAEMLSYSQFLDKTVILAMAAIWTLMPNDGIAVVTNWFYNKVMDLTIHRPYSRILEKEADRVGLHLMAKACYDVREGSVLWHRMSIDDDMTGEGRFPEWLSTHPAHDNRVKLIDQLIPKAIEERESCKCYRLPDTDPRRRAIQMRKVADNVMIARATKANLDRVHKDKQQIMVPTFQSRILSVFSKPASSLDDSSS